MIFSSRSSRGPDPHLRRKIQIFAVGAALGLTGIGLDSSLLVGLAILVLALGMVIRLIPAKDRTDEDRTDADGPDAGQGSGAESDSDPGQGFGAGSDLEPDPGEGAPDGAESPPR